jgi:hypothetical protein
VALLDSEDRFDRVEKGLPKVIRQSWLAPLIGAAAALGIVAAIGWLILVELPLRWSDIPGLTIAERTTSQN